MYIKYNYMYMCESIFLFSESLTKTFKYKIKSFTIEQKHFNKLILYKWRLVQLVVYNTNGIINITMN